MSWLTVIEFSDMDEAWVKEFKKTYRDRGPMDLRSQLPHLEKLCESYRHRARSSHSWLDFLKVGFRAFL